MNLLDQSDMKSALAWGSILLLNICFLVGLMIAGVTWPNSVGVFLLIVAGVATAAWLVWLVLYLIRNWDDVWL